MTKFCVLVTGGGRGIGRAIALAFAQPGHVVAIAARTSAEIERTAGEIAAKGAHPVAVVMDVTDETSVATGFSAIRAIAPAINVVVNNAGVGGGQHGSDDRYRQLAADPRYQRPRHIPGDAAGAADARRGGTHHQHVVRPGPLRCSRLHGVLRVEARGDRVHAGAGPRAHRAADHRQRHLSRLGRNRDGRAGDARRRQGDGRDVSRSSAAVRSVPSRSAASFSPRKSPTS